MVAPALSPFTEPLPAHDVACAHCQLPVPLGLLSPDGEQQFCCSGCRTVFAVIHDAGLDAYYDVRAREATARRRPGESSRSYQEFDDPAFAALFVRELGPTLRRAELYLEGIHCAACLWLVERLPRVQAGVLEARLDFGRGVLAVVWDAEQVRLSEIGRALASLGYPSHPQKGARAAEQRRSANHDLLSRMGVAAFAAGNAMLMAFALYGGWFTGMAAEFVALFRWGSLAVTAPAVLWAAAPFFRGAWAALRTRTPHMDLPISAGIAVGFAWGLWGTLRNAGDVYFDSVAMLIFVLLIGRYIQRRQQHTASDAAELIYSLAPAAAHLVTGDGVRDVPVQALSAGNLVAVHNGEKVPADGVVRSGSSSIDASLLTGESRPESVRAGSRVAAGSTNVGTSFTLEVELTGDASRIGRLMKSVEQAAARRAPVVLLADRISGYFVVTAFLLAALTVSVWWFIDPAHALEHGVALLIVTCPCALGMATPLAVSVALARAAQRGILVKGGDALEALARPGLIVFDKTGTLTEGRFDLVAWEGDRALEPLLRAAEARSSHPIAVALRRELPDPALAVDDLEESVGGGLTCRVSGRSLVIGSPEFVRERALVAGWIEEAVQRRVARCETPVLVAVDGQAAALLAFADPIRSDARASLRKLSAAGFELAILSGDHPGVVRRVEAELGVKFAFAGGGVSPEQKLEIVERLAKERRVVMVGDGVNDAAALSAASVGVSVHGGAEASLAAADVFLTRNGVAPVVELLRGAGHTFKVVQRNLGLSLLYNLVGVALAMGGLITPLIAAVLMPLSSLTVVASSYRANSFGGES